MNIKEKDFWEEETMDEMAKSEEKANRRSEEKKEAVKRIQDILDHITKQTGVEFDSKFASQLYRTINKETFTLNMKHANAIIAEWGIWKEYVDESSAKEYISHKLEVFCRIHCGVTYGYNHGEATAKSYIGNHAKLLRTPPENMYTLLHSNGSVSLNGRSYPVPDNDLLDRIEKRPKPKTSNIYYNPFARTF